MKHYDSINRIQDDGTLLGEDIWAFNKLDGQNFCVKYSPRKKEFGPFGSRKRMFDETDSQFGDTVKFFKNSKYPEILKEIVKNESGKKGVFTGVDEITFFFEWYGENSFAGFHKEGDAMHLALIDVNLKKKGYIEPDNFYKLFCLNSEIETPKLIYKGKLNKDFIDHIWEYPVEEHLKNPGIFENEPCDILKEGVVCTRSSLMKGQRLPKVKFKTKWWINKLHEKYSDEECKELE